MLHLQRSAGNRAVNRLVQRAVGYEFQMLRSQVDDKARLPVKLKGWELQNDSGNLEFVVSETDDAQKSGNRVGSAVGVAQHFESKTPFEKTSEMSRQTAQQLEQVRGHTTLTTPDAQPQINADIRVDQVEKFFTTYADQDLLNRERHGGNPQQLDPVLFRNRSSFSSWKKTRGELTESALTWIDPPQAVLEKLVGPPAPADVGTHVAMLRGLLRLMFQYLVHGKPRHMPPPDFMKDLPALSKSNMGYAAKHIAFRKNYNDVLGVPVHEMITDILTVMTGRTSEERVFSTIEESPSIARWVEILVTQGDDPLASLPDKSTGRPLPQHA